MTTFPIVNYRQRAVLSAAIIFSVVPTAAVLLRVIARRVSIRALNLSDHCAIIAAALTIALEAVSIAAVVHCGLAYGHASEIVAQFGSTPVVTLLKLVIPLQFLWTLSLGFSKTSILLLYSQLFQTEHYVVVAARATIATHMVWVAGTILTAFLICQPFSKHWETVSGGHCGDQVRSFIIIGTINLATNLVIIVLPLPSLYKLRMGIYKKLALVAVFGLGLLYVRPVEALLKVYLICCLRLTFPLAQHMHHQCHPLGLPHANGFHRPAIQLHPGQYLRWPRAQHGRNSGLHSSLPATDRPLQVQDWGRPWV